MATDELRIDPLYYFYVDKNGFIIGDKHKINESLSNRFKKKISEAFDSPGVAFSAYITNLGKYNE